MKITIGCDPELFLREEGKLISAWGVVPGDKKNPFRVDGGGVQVDGMALEFNTDPASSFKEFENNIKSVMTIMKEMVGEKEFAIQPVAEFGKEYIDQQPMEAKVLGCEPDYNAYTGEKNAAPDAGADFRTASGHIHIGWTSNQDPLSPAHFEDCRILAMHMDVLVGSPLIAAEGPNKRASLYGAPGAFRPKPYGMEYRTTSNFWLKRRSSREFVFGATKRAFESAYSGWPILNMLTLEDVVKYMNKACIMPGRYQDRIPPKLRSNHFRSLYSSLNWWRLANA